MNLRFLFCVACWSAAACESAPVTTTSGTASGDSSTASGSSHTSAPTTDSDTSITEGSTASSSTETSPETSLGTSVSATMAETFESSSSGGQAEPWNACGQAASEAECEAVVLSGDLPQPSCQWIDVHVLDVTAECTLVQTEARCIYFSGFLTGCGAGPGCELPNDGYMLIREVDDLVELLFYPHENICGPVPTAAPDETQWEDCTRPEHAACMCICGLLDA